MRVLRGKSYPGYEFSGVRVILGTSSPGCESSWVRVLLGASSPGYEFSWVRVFLGTSSPECEFSWARGLLGTSSPLPIIVSTRKRLLWFIICYELLHKSMLGSGLSYSRRCVRLLCYHHAIR